MRWFAPSLRRRLAVRPCRCLPALEPLEDRTAPATYIVVDTSDSGSGSLRDAITQVNSGIVNTIDFSIGALGSTQTIQVGSTTHAPLPAITQPVVIDGCSQGGGAYNGPPLIMLDGSAVTQLNGEAFPRNPGLELIASNSTIRGLAIGNFLITNVPTSPGFPPRNEGEGVFINGGTNDSVVDCYLGTTLDGLHAAPNEDGLIIDDASAADSGNNSVSRNVISGNLFDGVQLLDSATNTLQGNLIGLGADGFTPLGNGADGVAVASVNDVIDNLVTGNTISANGADGVDIGGLVTGGLVIQGNVIGLDASASVERGNGGDGVHIENGSAGNLVGGPTNADGNVIAGNGVGVVIDAGGFSSSNTVENNVIGTNDAGAAGLGNSVGVVVSNFTDNGFINSTVSNNVISGNVSDGVQVTAASHNVFSGNFVGVLVGNSVIALGNGGNGIVIANGSANNVLSSNVISGNTGDGVQLTAAVGNVVSSNNIGVLGDGVTSDGNGGDGLRIENGSSGNAIGAGNVIAYNAKGVVVADAGSVDDRITQNSIFANTGLGIDLGDDGVTPNGPPRSGPNDFQSFPVLTGVMVSGSSRTASGFLQSSPNANFTIEFFANDAFDPSGYGQGQVFLGSAIVTTDSTGLGTFVFTYTFDPAHPFLTATATSESGDTSEFSGRNLPPIISAPGPQSVFEDEPLTLTGDSPLSVSDPDGAASELLIITLTVTNGTITLGNVTGLTGTGNGTNDVTYTGTQAALNAALGTIVYTPDLHYAGPDMLTVFLADSGAVELGGHETATADVSITVVPRAEPAVLSVADALGLEASPVPLSLSAALSDPRPTETLSLQLSGVPLSARLSAGVDLGAGVWQLTPAQLNGLELLPDDNFTTELTLTATSTLPSSNTTAVVSANFTVTVADIPPTGTLSDDGPIDIGGTATASLTGVTDPSPIDTAAGFHYSFALSAAALATTYAQAGTAASQSFTFTQAGTFTIFARVFDEDSGFTDSTTVVVVRPIPVTSLVNDGPINEGSSVVVSFEGAPASGLRYSFALSPAGLATNPDQAGTSPSQPFFFDVSGVYTVFGRAFNRVGSFVDAATTVVVRNVAPTAVLSSNSPVQLGGAVIVTFTQILDPSEADTSAGFHFAYDFGNDGVFELGDGTYAGSVTASSAVVPLSFLNRGPGDYTIRARIIDMDGGFTDHTVVVTLSPKSTPKPSPKPPPILDVDTIFSAIQPQTSGAFETAAETVLTQLASALVPGLPLTDGSGTAGAPASEAPIGPGISPDAARLPPPFGLVDAALSRRAVGADTEEGQKISPGTARTLDVAAAVVASDDNVALFEDLVGKPTSSGAAALPAPSLPTTAGLDDPPAPREEAPPEPRADAQPAVSKPRALAARPPLPLGGLIRWLAQPWLVVAAGAWLFGRPRSRSDPNRSTRP
jgi:parallel beta-helix repeat protein